MAPTVLTYNPLLDGLVAAAEHHAALAVITTALDRGVRTLSQCPCLKCLPHCWFVLTNKVKRLTLPRIFFTRGGSEFVAYPLPSIRLAAHAECQRFISYRRDAIQAVGFGANCVSCLDADNGPCAADNAVWVAFGVGWEDRSTAPHGTGGTRTAVRNCRLGWGRQDMPC